MDVWTDVVLQWIRKCNFSEGQLVSLRDADLETFFCSYVKYLGLPWNINTKSDGALRDFIQEAYDKFTINCDPEGLVIETEKIYTFTLLIHFVYARTYRARTYRYKFYNNILDKLPYTTKNYITEFLDQSDYVDEMSREAVDELIINVKNVYPMEQISVLSHSDESVMVKNNGSAVKQDAEKEQSMQDVDDHEQLLVKLQQKLYDAQCKLEYQNRKFFELFEIFERKEDESELLNEKIEYAYKSQLFNDKIRIASLCKDIERAFEQIDDKQEIEMEDKGTQTVLHSKRI